MLCPTLFLAEADGSRLRPRLANMMPRGAKVQLVAGAPQKERNALTVAAF
jgi:hypothetical protein